MKTKLLKYVPVGICSVGLVYSYFQNNSLACMGWFLLWVLSCIPFYFAQDDYIKACTSHFEVMRGKEVIISASYSDIGMITLTLESSSVRSPKFGSKGRDAALISLHSHDSDYLRSMHDWSALKRKREAGDHIYVSIPFAPNELHLLMERTHCNLYITEQVYKLYEQDLYPLEAPFGKRIYICFKQGQQSSFTSLQNYRRHIFK